MKASSLAMPHQPVVPANTNPATTLLLPSVQVNIRAGNFLPPDANRTIYLRITVRVAA